MAQKSEFNFKGFSATLAGIGALIGGLWGLQSGGGDLWAIAWHAGAGAGLGAVAASVLFALGLPLKHLVTIVIPLALVVVVGCVIFFARFERIFGSDPAGNNAQAIPQLNTTGGSASSAGSGATAAPAAVTVDPPMFLYDSSGRAPGEVLSITLEHFDVEFRFRWIPPGSFTMGSPPQEEERWPDEGPLRRVTFTEGFWMHETEITQAQWIAVMGAENNPSSFTGDLSRPVETVSWHDTQSFIEKVAADPALTRSELRIRLPSEAEWEYACRAGTTTPFFFGATISTNDANYNGDYVYGDGVTGVARGSTMPVGSFPPNAWGLHDMHGNVWEWCADVWHDNYVGSPTDGSAWTTGGVQSHRVLRGGSWYNSPRWSRSANRTGIAPDYRYFYIGFRLALDSY